MFPAVKRGSNWFGAAALGLVLAAVATGCGNDEPDLVNGKTKFTERCASCHALARANAKGVTGPDLDAAFDRSRENGLGEETFEGVVLRQIANVRRNSKMPADLVTGDDARDVAAYVAAVAAKPGEDQGALANAGQPKVSNKPIPAKGGKLEIAADPSGALAFVSTKATAPPGSIEFSMPNESQVDHNIALREDGGGQLIQEGEVVGGGGVSTFTANLKPGKFQFVCTVPGHEEGGMQGTLTVK